MPTVRLREGDTFEGAMRKFKRVVDKARILQELRLRECHLSGSVLKQRQRASARKRLAKRLFRENCMFKDMARSRSSGRNFTSQPYAKKTDNEVSR